MIAVHKVAATYMVLKKNKQIRQPVKLEIAGAAPVGTANILEYPSGDGTGLISQQPLVRFLPPVPIGSRNTINTHTIAVHKVAATYMSNWSNG